MKSFFSFLLVFSALSLRAQPSVQTALTGEEEEIKKVIEHLFNGMRKSDTGMLGAVFAPSAIMQTIVHKKDGAVVVRTDEVKSFINSVGKPHPEVLDERIQFGHILIDANLATVWTPYKFYIGNNFSHCGVNSFQLVKLNGSWKIQYIIDTRRKDACQ